MLAPSSRRRHRLRGAVRAGASWMRARLPHVLVVGVLVLLALAQRPGERTFDTKLDLVEDPIGFLQRAASLWNPEANLGELQNQAYGYLFPIGPFFAGGDLLGVPPWLTQRLWCAMLLGLAYAGVVLLCRALGVGTRPARIIAGLAYALCPRMVSTLGPISAEALTVALLPWVVVPLLRWREHGVRRAAARSGLAVLGMGAANAALTLAVLPLPALVILGTRPAAVRRRLAAWWVAAVVLACAWWVVPLLLLGRYAPPFLDLIESAENTAGGVGLSGALRGATHWVAGLVIGGEPWWPAGYEVTQTTWLVATSMVAGAVGLLGLTLGRVSLRTPFLVSALLGLVLLSTGRLGAVGSPLAETWRSLLDGPLVPFRNVHKFDPLVRLPAAIGLAHVIGLLTEGARVRGLRRRWAGRVVAGALAVCALATLVPALAPGLRPGPGWTRLPGAWEQAADFVAEQDAFARTLVLPSAGFGTQGWGRTVDEPLQPLASAPWVSRAQVFLGSAGATRWLDGLDEWLETGRGSPALADALARGGIRFVVLRSDLDRRLSSTPPPAAVRQALERSAGISRVAGFGPIVGGDVAGPLTLVDHGVDPPAQAVEVYEVDRLVPRARLVGSEALIGVTGGPESVPRLLEEGLVQPWEATVTAADGADADLPRWLVTDDLVRRERSFGRIRDDLGPALTATSILRQNRGAPDVLPPGAEDRLTVARYDQLRDVTASSAKGYADAAGRTDVALAPWSAVDGDPFTAWRTDGDGDPRGEWLRLDLLVALDPAGTDVRVAPSSLIGPRVTSVSVRTERGERTTTVLGDGSSELLDVPPGPTRFLELRITDADGGDGEVGIVELTVPGLTPARTLVAADDQPRVGAAAVGPSAVAMHRTQPVRPACLVVGLQTRCDPDLALVGDEPTGLDRSFTTRTSTTYELSGNVLARPGSTAQALLEPLGGLQAMASSLLAGDLAVAGARAVDGNPATSWVADSFDVAPSLELSWAEPRTIDRIQLVESSQPAAAAPLEVTVEAAGRRTVARVGDGGWVELPPVTADRMRITFDRWRLLTSVDRSTRVRTAVPVGVSEVVVPALQDLYVNPDPDGPTGRSCGFGPALEVDGTRIPTEVVGTFRDLLEDRPLRWQACDGGAVELSAGLHRVVVRADEVFAPDSVVLRSSAEGSSTPDDDGVLLVATWESTRRVVSVRTEGSTVLVVPENANEGWVATAAGQRLAPVQIDGWQQGWRLPDDFAGRVQLDFVPQRPYVASLLGGALLALALVALALRRGRSEPTPGPDSASAVTARQELVVDPTAPLGRARVFVVLATAAAGVLVAGPLGGLVLGAVAVIVVVGRRQWAGWWRVGVVAVAVVGVTVGAAVGDDLGRSMATVAVLPLLGVLLAETLGARRTSVRKGGEP